MVEDETSVGASVGQLDAVAQLIGPHAQIEAQSQLA